MGKGRSGGPDPDDAKIGPFSLFFMAFFWVSGGIYGNEALATAAPAGVIFLLNVVVWAREIGGSGGPPGRFLCTSMQSTRSVLSASLAA
jgi:hypothetical protein